MAGAQFESACAIEAALHAHLVPLSDAMELDHRAFDLYATRPTCGCAGALPLYRYPSLHIAYAAHGFKAPGPKYRRDVIEIATGVVVGQLTAHEGWDWLRAGHPADANAWRDENATLDTPPITTPKETP